MMNKDVPGVIGRVGTIMADYEINIAEYNLARTKSGGKAMAIITIDSPPRVEALSALRLIPAVEEVRLISL